MLQEAMTRMVKEVWNEWEAWPSYCGIDRNKVSWKRGWKSEKEKQEKDAQREKERGRVKG